MQATLEVLPGLERKLTVIVPSDQIDQEIDKRLKEMAPKVKIEGFRPGKVPPHILRQRFGISMRYEVLEKIVGSTYGEAIAQEKLTPAGMPDIKITQDKAGEPLEYQALLEVYPEFTPKGLASAELQKINVDVTPADADAMIEKLRHQKAKWIDVDRTSQKGDKVIVSFEGRLDGELFNGGSGKDVTLELGSGSAIPGFEEGFTHHKAGDEIKMDLTFPTDYHSQDLAGKSVEFQGTLHKVQAPELPALDDEAFLKQFRVEEGGVEKLRQNVLERLQNETKQQAEDRLKAALFEKLLELNPIDLPKALVEQEVKRLMEEQQAYLARLGVKHTLEPTEEIKRQAKERVHLGLLMSEIARESKLTPDPQRVEQLLEKTPASYPDMDPAVVIQAYRSNKELLQQLESRALEDTLIETLMAEAKVTQKNMSYTEFTSPASLTSNKE